MLEKNAIACTEVVQSRFSVGSFQETQTRTFTMTSLQPEALAALTGKGFLLESAEAILLGAIKHLRQAVCAYVAQLVLWKDEVVAGIHIAVMFHHGSMPALLCIDTNTRFHPHPTSKGCIEKLYEDLAYILTHPFAENGTHEMPPLFRTDAERSDGTILIEEMGQMPSVTMFTDALHNGTNLQELAMQFVAEESVEGKRVLGIIMIGSCHCVPFHTIFVEQTDSIHHSFPCASTLRVKTIGIVLLLSPIDTDAHKPAFIVKELTPFRGKV